MNHIASPCGCSTDEIGMSKAHQPHYCDHGNLFRYSKPLSRSGGLSSKTNGSKKARGGGLRKGRGFAVAPKQREKVKGLPCVMCAIGPEEAKMDPAHLWPRGMGGCDHPDCVVPLCRSCHRQFDGGEIDLLPRLVGEAYFPEIAHPITAHYVSPTQLLERLTGTHWRPVEREAA